MTRIRAAETGFRDQLQREHGGMLTLLLIILVVVLLFGGGGFYYRGRGRRGV
jgi:hypothetical protein